MENKNEFLVRMLAKYISSECYPIDYSFEEAFDVGEQILSEINEFEHADTTSPYASIQDILDSYMIPKTFADLFLD